MFRRRQPFIITFLILIFIGMGFYTAASEPVMPGGEKTEGDTSAEGLKMDSLMQEGNRMAYKYPDSALKDYFRGLELARMANDINREGYFHTRIGGIYYTLGDYDKALERFSYALDLFRKTGNRHGIAWALNDIGLIDNMFNREAQAIERHRQSIAMSRELGDSLLWAHNLHNMGLNYENLGKLDSALICADSGIRVAPRADGPHTSYAIRVFRGWLLSKLNLYDEAYSQFMTVLNDTSYHNIWDQSYAWLGVATVEKKRGNTAKSTSSALRSLELAEQMNAWWDLQQITLLLSENFAASKDFEKAYLYHIRYKTYSDSLFSQSKERQIHKLQLQLQEDANILLTKENSLQNQQIRNRNTLILAFIITLALLIILALVLFQKYRQKSHLNRELALKNKEIAQANQELKQINSTRDSMINIMAHDLRSPMSVMFSFTELLKDEFNRFTDKEVFQIIQTLNRTSAGGIQLLENLLNWSRSQTQRLEVNPVDCNLTEMVREAVRFLSPAAEAKQINLQNTVPDGVRCLADKNMTAVILRNLLSNAIKFTRNDGIVTISTEETAEWISVSITDTGIGIGRQLQDILLDSGMFQSRPGTANEKGAGIGLALSKEFIERMGGTLTLESKPGQGSRFTFTLSRSPKPEVRDQK